MKGATSAVHRGTTAVAPTMARGETTVARPMASALEATDPQVRATMQTDCTLPGTNAWGSCSSCSFASSICGMPISARSQRNLLHSRESELTETESITTSQKHMVVAAPTLNSSYQVRGQG